MPRSDSARLMDFVKLRGVVLVDRRSVSFGMSGFLLGASIASKTGDK